MSKTRGWSDHGRNDRKLVNASSTSSVLSSVGRDLDKAARLIPRERIQDYCEAVARKFRPERIILFGSYAYGRPTPDSDVDLLVILDFRGNDVTKAIEIRASFDTPFALDLLVRKPKFIEERLRERDMFIEMVLEQGIVAYEKKQP